MDKVLTRKLFKDRYLQTVSKRISNFKEGGLASLRAKRFQVGGPIFTQGERQAMILSPLVSSLLTGTKRPGQSELGAVASNIGAGLPGATATALQIGKIEEEGRKKSPLKTAIDLRTGQETFVDEATIRANPTIFRPPEGFLPKLIEGLETKKQIQVKGEEKKIAEAGLNNADAVIKATSRLVNDITNPQTATGVVGDATLFLGSISGGLEQIVNKDPDYNFGKFKEILDGKVENKDDPELRKLFDSIKTQEAKTTLINLAYLQAKAADPGGRLSDKDLAYRLKALGESANKPAFVAGLRRSALDSVEPAITNYQRAYGISADELPPQYQDILNFKKTYYGQPTQEKQKQTKGEPTTDSFSPTNLFKLKQVSP
jgi:hypothetical protein